MGGIVDSVFGGGGDDAAKASERGAELQAEGQREALEYLKQTERLPQAYREQAMSQLGMLYGLPGLGAVPYGGYAGQESIQQPMSYDEFVAQRYPSPVMQPQKESNYFYGDNQPLPFSETVVGRFAPEGYLPPQLSGVISGNRAPRAGTQDYRQEYEAYLSGQEPQDGFSPMDKAAFVEALQQDPFYESLMQQGEQAVLRGASATGGLRSGTASENLAVNSQNVLRGLYGEQVQGLQGLAGTSSYAPQIASQMAGIGQTLGQGQIAAGQAQQAGQQQGIGNLLGLGKLGLGIAGLF